MLTEVFDTFCFVKENMFVTFLTILIFVAATSEALNCTNPGGPKAVKCLEVFIELGDNAKGFNISNKTSTTKMIENCGKFNRCRRTLDCLIEQKFVYAVNITLMFCDTVQFFSKQFIPCQILLDARASECSKNWNPYPKEIPDKVKMAEIQKVACENFFGKHGCMQKEITETCGAEMWTGFKKVRGLRSVKM